MSQSLKPALRRSLLDALLILSILLILIVTLLPQHGLGGRRVSLLPFHDISQAVRGGTIGGNGLLAVLGNLLLFVPFGFVAAIRWAGLARPHRMAILGALSSSMLELVQFFMGGRSSSIDDVILNTAGAVLGVVVAGGVAGDIKVWLLPPKQTPMSRAGPATYRETLGMMGSAGGPATPNMEPDLAKEV
jgi:hypothetical protein